MLYGVLCTAQGLEGFHRSLESKFTLRVKGVV